MSDHAIQNTTEAPVAVLVVDDERPLLQTYEAILKEGGCEVDTAASGREALQLLMQKSFDVLVVDLKMEEMNGIVFLQEALKIWPWIGVVIVSAYVTDEVRPRAAALGVTRILEKPITLRTLCDNVREEAMEKRGTHVDISRTSALALMRDHLKLLTGLGQKHVGAESLIGALAEFGRSLAKMLRSYVAGIFLLEEQEETPTLLMTSRVAVGNRFLEALELEMLDRFGALSGLSIEKESVDVRFDGAPASEDGPGELGHTLSVPIILEGEVCGLLSLASGGDEQYSPADVSLLYHAANHVSAVFMTLRRMHRLATMDPLTGLFNRIRLEEELERAWMMSRRYETSMGVVVVDIDNFKTLNDSFGHVAGDTILREFAEVLQSVARTTDVVARYGGDEFVAVLPRADDSAALVFAERLMSAVRETCFCENTRRLSLTISIGIATSANPTAPSTGDALLSQADRALYMAKRRGRDRACVWPGQLETAPDAPKDPTEVIAAEPAAPCKGRVILVDDEPAILKMIKLMLKRAEYEVTTFESATDAIATIKKHPGHFDVLLTDIGLPDINGIELMHEVRNLDQLIVSVVMTGNATVNNAVRCLREGAYDFIEKPIDHTHLLALLQRATEFRGLRVENERYQAHLEEMVRDRSAQLAASLEEIRESYEFTLEALVAMLDAREHHTGKHSLRVRELTVSLARSLDVGGQELEVIATGALLHDIGKIAIPDAILFRPGPLSDEEWEEMKRHSEIGYQILKSSPFLRDPAEMVYEHHEHFDGSGYPRGLAGEDICLGARIFSVCDAYDAMRSRRVYRKGLAPEEAQNEVRRSSGTQFDPRVVEAFLAHTDEMERVLERVQD